MIPVIISLFNQNNPLVKSIAKQLGAKRVGLCAPYLAYMRQDKQFHTGEGITSQYFAALLSNHFDWLITVDPHLHRYHSLSEIYSIPATAIHAALEVANWIKAHVKKPLLIGPDEESEQWVKQVAADANAAHLILQKVRHGDADVEVSRPDVEAYQTHTPILIDDIISTAQTMIKTTEQLKTLKMKPPICIGVHAIFAENANQALTNAYVDKVLTCNAIPHPTNEIDLSVLIADHIKQQA